MNSLRFFRVFADTLNFTHAAEQLNLSQPALHTKIQELSKSLGTVLYSKQGRQLQLTPKGEQLAQFAREMETRWHDFEQQFHDQPQQPLRLAAGQGAYHYMLGDALKQYSGTLQLLLGDAETVRCGQAHLGVGPAPADRTGLEIHPWKEVGQVLLLPKEHPLARKRKLRLLDCQNLELIVPPADRPQRRLLDGQLPPYRVAAEAVGWELTLHFVSLGMGMAVVNSFCPTPKGFVARPLGQLPSVSYQLFLPKGYPRPAARQLAELILKT